MCLGLKSIALAHEIDFVIVWSMYLHDDEDVGMPGDFFSLTTVFRSLFQILIIVSMLLAKTEVRAWMG